MLVKGASRTCSDAEQTPRLLQVCRGTSPSDLYLHSYQEKCQKCAGQTLGKALRSGFDCEQCGVQLMFVVNAVFLLQANLPLLQRELLHCARAAKQTPAQYLSQHEHLLLSTSVPSPADSTELLLEPNESSRRHSPNRYEHSHKIPRQYYSKVMVSDNGYSYATFSPYSAIQYKTYFLLLKIKLQ